MADRSFGFKAFAFATLILCASLAFAARSERVLTNGWRFSIGDPPNAEAVDFDDSTWEQVTLPHAYNLGDGTPDKRKYRGPAWYRLKLDFDHQDLKKNLFLRFAAASLVAQVYLNGQKVGEHKGGFAAFCMPINGAAKLGANELAVRVDNARNPDVPPLSGDFTVYGGLYREVKLLALADDYITPTDDGGPGFYLTPSADGTVSTRIQLGGKRGNTTVRVLIQDASKRIVAQDDSRVSLSGNSSTFMAATSHVNHPHLWDGVLYPYLYTAHAQVLKDGRVLDEMVQPLGFRSYKVDPQRGVILNGKPYDLHGVDLHQGRPSVGWAATAAMQDEDYKMVADIGATGVRMAHYQHGEHEFELCDRLGLMVWAELPLVNLITDDPAFKENASQQLRELIKQNYNHPSFAFLSLYNEPAVDRKLGDSEWHFVEDLVKQARRADGGRPVTGAMSLGANFWLAWVGDLASFNRYWGWYGGRLEQWGKSLDEMKTQAGGRSFGISEYGAGASVIQHEVPPKQPEPGGKWHPEEWQALAHETIWPQLAARPWIWCKFIWVMFDFGSDTRNEGDRPGINDKGLVTDGHQLKKDAYFYYQAQWTLKPMVYLTSRRFKQRPSGATQIRVYSNCGTVRLTLNGTDAGQMREIAPHVLVLVVNLAAGKNLVSVVGSTQGKPDASDRCDWECPSAPSGTKPQSGDPASRLFSVRTIPGHPFLFLTSCLLGTQGA